MYHPRLKGSHYEMGRKFGSILKKDSVKFPINLDDFQKDFGIKSQEILNDYFPEAIAEIKGITDVMEIDNDIFTSWMMCMGCCLDISENKSVEIRGCTAFAFTKKGQVYYGRNNDLPPYLKKVSKSIYYKPEGWNEFILNTSSFINGEEGINDKGLVVAMTFVKPNIDEIKPGINSVFLVRYLLEKCSDIEEALEDLNKLPIASSCNILLTDKNGEMVVVECTPNKVFIRKPIKKDNGDKYIITVNHFVSSEMWKHDASNRNEYESKRRYSTAFNALLENNTKNPIEYAKEILMGKYGFMCQFDKSLNFETIWSTVIDVNRIEMLRAEGDPRKAKYKMDKRLKTYNM